MNSDLLMRESSRIEKICAFDGTKDVNAKKLTG